MQASQKRWPQKLCIGARSTNSHKEHKYLGSIFPPLRISFGNPVFTSSASGFAEAIVIH